MADQDHERAGSALESEEPAEEGRCAVCAKGRRGCAGRCAHSVPRLIRQDDGVGRRDPKPNGCEKKPTVELGKARKKFVLTFSQANNWLSHTKDGRTRGGGITRLSAKKMLFSLKYPWVHELDALPKEERTAIMREYVMSSGARRTIRITRALLFAAVGFALLGYATPILLDGPPSGYSMVKSIVTSFLSACGFTVIVAILFYWIAARRVLRLIIRGKSVPPAK